MAWQSGKDSSEILKPIIIDTDMSIDDLMAILYLLQRGDVSVKAITVTGTGLAHGAPGTKNALDLLALTGNAEIPIACGRETPLACDHEFPALRTVGLSPWSPAQRERGC